MIIGSFKCPCGKCDGGAISLRLARALFELTEILPEYVNIIIHSLFRCPEHNKEVGGGHFSKHLFGDAIDCHGELIDLLDLLRAIESVEYFYNGGIGFYEVDGTTGWIHCDVRQTEHKARWIKKNGVFVNSNNGLFITD